MNVLAARSHSEAAVYVLTHDVFQLPGHDPLAAYREAGGRLAGDRPIWST